MASTPGEGTVVEIHLPRCEPVAGPVAAKRDAAPALRPDLAVLVVEDDPLVRGVAVEYLKMAGIMAQQASDGHAAVAILEGARAIDIVLSDVIMPGGLSGLDLAEIIRQRWPRTAILFMSGYSYDEFARHGIDPDTIGLLRKPFTKRELLRKLQDTVSVHTP
jgi:two-component system NtrC family sensor kinase